MAKIDGTALEKVQKEIIARKETWQKEMTKGGDDGMKSANKAGSAATDAANLERIIKRCKAGGIYAE